MYNNKFSTLLDVRLHISHFSCLMKNYEDCILNHKASFFAYTKIKVRTIISSIYIPILCILFLKAKLFYN